MRVVSAIRQTPADACGLLLNNCRLRSKVFMNSILTFLKSRWFLVSLLTLITAGLFVGYHSKEATLKVSTVLRSDFITPMVLFLMAFSLDSSQLKASFRRPGPVLWACLVNMALLPLIGWASMRLQLADHFRIGVMIAASVPCTVAAASVCTRRAAGNDAISLLTTLLTNGLCFVTTPFWLQMATGNDVHLDSTKLAKELLLTVLLPSLAGQLVRVSSTAAQFAKVRKQMLGVIAQSGILSLVFVSACKAGPELQQSDIREQIAGLGVAWITCATIHLLGLIAANYGGRALRFSDSDRIGAAFAGSQKTLPVGLFLASSEAFAVVPFVVFPMLMFHSSQLIIDTLVADRFARRSKGTS